MTTHYKITGWRHNPDNKSTLIPYQVDFDDIYTTDKKRLKQIYEKGFDLICKEAQKELPKVIIIDQITLWRVGRYGYFKLIDINQLLILEKICNNCYAKKELDKDNDDAFGDDYYSSDGWEFDKS